MRISDIEKFLYARDIEAVVYVGGFEDGGDGWGVGGWREDFGAGEAGEEFGLGEDAVSGGGEEELLSYQYMYDI